MFARVQLPDLLARPIIELSGLDLALAGGLVLLAVGISRWQGLGLERAFVVGAVRMVVQLILVGYALVYVFALNRWYLVLAALLLMLAVATWTAVDRQEGPRRALLGITGAALLLGSGLTLLYVGAVVVRPEPWYNPRYLIPLFGMIVANAMNAAALAGERLAQEMEMRRAEIEAYLALGAEVGEASQAAVRAALRASLIPTINSLMVVGIVSLPGMMTGQILAGASPVLAVRYQILVMFMLAASVALTAGCMTLWYRGTFFTPALQLRDRAGG
ncbi:MAG TPA: iron export ABC transporter permease subunit FetB [Longimicrobiaceae bacterium]|nr:iron export ABC transporter permease subunit FetB [Longimicrobiaceae bacterium]